MKKFLNLKVIIIVILHFLLSFCTDRIFFSYSLASMGDIVRLCMFKGIFWVVLFVVWTVVFRLIEQIKNKTIDKDWFVYSVVYLGILSVLLLCTWPGIWQWDEFFVLSQNQTLHMHIWQSLITNLVYIESLMLLPFPTGIIIVQAILISVIVGYVLSTVVRIFSIKKWRKILVFVPFLFLPVLYFAICPLRLSLYSFFEILVLTILLKGYREKAFSKYDLLKLPTRFFPCNPQ